METENKGLFDRLTEYSNSDTYPFHMPGHKRRELPFPNPYSIDITEINGFDNLHHAEGILKESMEQAAKIYGADRTYYLVNGSTIGILSAICGTTTCGGTILMARNGHVAAYNGVILNRLRPIYLYPEGLPYWGITGEIHAEDVRRALEEGEKPQAVLITSPTYEGIVSDIAAIADVVHAYGIPLIVDEAHGAHLPFAQNGFPKSALDYGADVVIQSLHKTLPSFTQTAVLHIKGSLVKRDKIERYLKIFQSSSPSYLFMAGIERCIRYMDETGRGEMSQYAERLHHFYKETESLKTLKVLNKEIIKELGVFAWDPSKIVISTGQIEELSGEDLAELLRQEYRIEVEMSASTYLIAMTSVMDTDEGFERLKKALLEIDGMISEVIGGTGRQVDKCEAGISEAVSKPGSRSSTSITADVVLPPAEALDLPEERVSLTEAAGMISKEFIYVYPPGIPILAPGEKIAEVIIRQIECYQAEGLSVQGTGDPSVSTILIVAPEV